MRYCRKVTRTLWFVAIVLSGEAAWLQAAEPPAPARTVRIIGRKSVTVTTPEIRLAEIASVSSSRSSDDDIIIGLQKIVIDPAPTPGKSDTISAARVLERLREEGIELRQVGYSLPRLITVKRASRTLGYEEVKAAIEASLVGSGRDVSLREVDYRKSLEIAPGQAEIEVAPLEGIRPGQCLFGLTVKVEGQPEARLRVKATLDEWREIPVAARQIGRGSVIGAQDVRMARLNLGEVPQDAAVDIQQVVGFETGHSIGDGEVFRSAKLALPPVISAGSSVMIVYRSRFMEASAAGTAMESGAAGQRIKVRNDSSKKSVMGIVLEPGLVRVSE